MARDLRVHPSNPDVTIHYFLVEITTASGKHIDSFKTSQAWNGRWSNRKEQNAWNKMQVTLSTQSIKTGLEFHVVAHGTEAFVDRVAKEKGWCSGT